jgi:hypothetical protein
MSDVIVAPSPIHRLGVFATRDFSAGETVLCIDDSRKVDESHPLRPEAFELERHCDYLAGGRVVLMKMPERHINSSCDPNTFIKTIGEFRQVIARRPVRGGDEITCDYIINCHGGEVWDCRCKSGHCRGTIVSSFFELPVRLQLDYLPLLDDWFVREHEVEVTRLRSGHAPGAGLLTWLFYTSSAV